ncbi:hypothetical protein PFICI_06538 [Pestalotiopsis fici W106-1]|uniref:Uncharacterized protein n=1 Tax=Pestalotiopsis fici (strain W106-1 / CGMCC3.15140) TaxID=1229662 RepID=W3X8M1_PESFW|nr:uncharacterized protein PFICI_06538 [Pestalotiopsis fici W106-1]ETS81536.1 hypothetical protein PFICI_06538 [Pestalotiopsis fici W106-1]
MTGTDNSSFQILAALFFSTATAILLAIISSSRNSSSAFPTINGRRPFELSDARVKKNFIINGRQLLRNGLEKFNGKPFRILTDHGSTLIFSPAYTQELRNLDNLSHVRAIAQIVDVKSPGFEAFYEFAYGRNIVQDVVKAKITPALKWHAVPLHSVILQAVAQVSSRLFLGEELCRDPDWLRITTTYTHHITKAALELKAWPGLLRPFVIRFLPHGRALISLVKEAEELLGSVLKNRRDATVRGTRRNYTDAIEWFDQMAKGRKYNPVHVQLTLSFVAIHTTADMVTQVMFDLAQHPEYIEPLRQEAIKVLGKDGWKKTCLYELKLMDSVLKEVQRLRPINDTSLQRLALEDVTLADGTRIPRGTLLAVASTRHWDPQVYPDPYTFDGYRFFKLRQEKGKENTSQFVSTGQNHLGFGHGQHACPGRFFASNEIKIILCHILLKYDWRLIEGEEPEIVVHGFNLIADPHRRLEIRRREEELSIDNL